MASGRSQQETRVLYTLEDYLSGHGDEIEITERGVVWFITGG